jgi:S1-C subfamily serine protease
VLALSACGGGDDSQPKARVVQTQTTKVEVVKGLGQKGSFDAQSIYDRLSPGVVTVIAISASSSGNRARGGLGSGFVLDSDGYIATNAHVITDNGKPARDIYVQFGDGNRLPARAVGTDPDSKLVPLPLGASRNLVVGAPVAAIGSPFGEEQSLSTGVVSAVNRNIESLNRRFRIGDAIQTDAAINHGNSGGPLLDAKGRVIGINSQIRSTGGGGEGVGFAIPVETVKRSLDQLRAKGRTDYAYLGITSVGLYPQLAEKLGLEVLTGALVEKVESGSPAGKAGLRVGDKRIDFQGQRGIPVGSDVIVAVDGKRLNATDDLPDVVGLHRPGDKIKLEVLRGGKTRTVVVTLSRRPERG